MSDSTAVSQFRIREGTGIVVMSRVVDWQCVKVLKASVSSIAYYIYNLKTGLDQPILKTSGSCVVATSWSDSYLTAGWTADAVGYNAYCPIPASAFTGLLTDVKGCRYHVEIIGTPTSGDDFWIADFVIDATDGLSRGT